MMTDVLKTVTAVIIAIMSWSLMLIVLGFITRVNFEIFMIGWGFIK